MCSGSILVTTPIWVGSFKKVPSDSSASTTIHSPLPMRALVPQALIMPPAITVGSRLAALSRSAMSAVVVVLPWVPVIDTVAHGLEIGAVLEVAPLHAIAARVHHLGNGVHADAADAHDVEQACLVGLWEMHRRTLHHLLLGSREFLGEIGKLPHRAGLGHRLRLCGGGGQKPGRGREPLKLSGKALRR